MFPRLKERRASRGTDLSGGERQLFRAIGRALIRDPKIVLLDEPFEGLAPILVHELLGDLWHFGRGRASESLWPSSRTSRPRWPSPIAPISSTTATSSSRSTQSKCGTSDLLHHHSGV